MRKRNRLFGRADETPHSPAGLPHRHFNIKISNARKAPPPKKKSQTNFKMIFIFTSHEKLQIEVITILPSGMCGTYGINIVQCGDAVKSLQALLESNCSALTLTIASRIFSCILCLAFLFTEDERENILSTTALLTGFKRQVRAIVASSLTALYLSTPIQNFSVSAGGPFFLNGAFSFQPTKGIFLYCSSIFLTLFPA